MRIPTDKGTSPRQILTLLLFRVGLKHVQQKIACGAPEAAWRMAIFLSAFLIHPFICTKGSAAMCYVKGATGHDAKLAQIRKKVPSLDWPYETTKASRPHFDLELLSASVGDAERLDRTEC